ncbi:carboxymuconolactone decarboxylase family protein [Streptomyces sp. NPDC014744]|uniref:carboxymuconolactone decarboxylase family protein n=1 Tax=Streptomyces sp. NPDC014744 TaxID=3364903 RepID=UPI003700B7DF
MEPRFNLFDSPTAAKVAKRFYNASLPLGESTLPKSLRELVELRVGQINGCGFCVDIHTKEAAAAGETALRLNLVAVWRHSTVFTDAERAALALAEEGTRLGDHGVSDETWAEVRKHFCGPARDRPSRSGPAHVTATRTRAVTRPPTTEMGRGSRARMPPMGRVHGVGPWARTTGSDNASGQRERNRARIRR